MDQMATIGSGRRTHKAVRVPNMIFSNNNGWENKNSEEHPTLVITVSTDAADYGHLSLPTPNISPKTVRVVTDSGCQSRLIGLQTFYNLGLKKSDLVKCESGLSAVNREKIEILGAIFLRLSGKDITTGRIAVTVVQVYATPVTKRFYISRHAMRQLGIIGPDFPRINAAKMARVKADDTVKAPCGCPRHVPLPTRPESLLFPATEGNIAAMNSWLLERFSASTFNNCKHQHLPMMKMDPIRIHIDDTATLVVARTATTIPIHWREEISDMLAQDVALGVIEKVEIGTPTTWCARMHVVAKWDGSPRRTVDLRPQRSLQKRKSTCYASI
jgi:hypothetical protein